MVLPPESLGLHATPSAPWLKRLCQLQAAPQNAAVSLHNPFRIPPLPMPSFQGWKTASKNLGFLGF